MLNIVRHVDDVLSENSHCPKIMLIEIRIVRHVDDVLKLDRNSYCPTCG